MIRLIAILATLTLSMSPAFAAQSLIPTPYPSAVGGGQPLNPMPDTGGPEHLMDDPYPDAAGKNSQGNPLVSTARGRHHQRLVPSIKQRKYRVDRD